jgi:D-alanine transaminase
MALAFVNGRYLPQAQAWVHAEDRGFQFADGVYEVVALLDGHLMDFDAHMDRLARSLEALRLSWPMSRAALALVMRELIRRNGVTTGLIYLQITRGSAPRDFKFPAPSVRPTLVMTVRRVTRFGSPTHIAEGVPIITIPDIRWLRRDIKSVSLLPQVLGKQQAVEAGAFEAWMVDADGLVTEGCSSNAWIVSADGVLITRPTNHLILSGVTRGSLLQLAAEFGIATEIRPFSVAEAKAAPEAFLSSATTFALPVTRIDGQPVGTGRPGAITLRLRQAYLATVGGVRS